MEKYLLIEPSGKVSWINVVPYLRDQTFKGLIGCEYMEVVRTVIENVCLIVDDEGKVKPVPQQHNELASRLYRGWLCGADNIAGPAIVAGLHPDEDGELDFTPLAPLELAVLEFVGIPVPKED